MHTNRISTAFLVILAAAALAGPAAAIADQSGHTASATPGHTAPGPPTWPVDPQPIAGPSAPGPPTWPVDPQPIIDPSAPVSNTSASGFDWGSAAIGAAAVAALVAAFGGAAGLRRRHQHQAHVRAADHPRPGPLSAETGNLISPKHTNRIPTR